MPFRVGQTGGRGYESGIIATNKTKTETMTNTMTKTTNETRMSRPRRGSALSYDNVCIELLTIIKSEP